MFWTVTLPNIRWALLYGVLLCNARAMGEFGAVAVVSGKIRGETATMPIMIEMLYNEYLSVAAFGMAALLTLLALVTLGLKTALEWRHADQLRATGAPLGRPAHAHRDRRDRQGVRRHRRAAARVARHPARARWSRFLGPSGSGKTTLLRILGGPGGADLGARPVRRRRTPPGCACRTAARASCSSPTRSSGT